ncbi:MULTISPECIES: hypothetical protein [Chromobacterium]|uniref:hypothetical protein n=1 Tax=Chromobacterium TaxID=535 RepID=UPI0013C2FE76|nr:MULTISPECIES: hypothetical protein [Chromobacterium]MDH0344189.1 hypothetical protein [Chromobacterium haemolyticum]
MLTEKLIEHRAKSFIKKIEGLTHHTVLKISPNDFSKNREFIREECNIDSSPIEKIPQENTQYALETLSELITKHHKQIFIPFEQPYIIKADVLNPHLFIKSIWRENNTRDFLIFFDNNGGTLDLQDREDALYLFHTPIRGK